MSTLKYTYSVFDTAPQASPRDIHVYEKNLLIPHSPAPFFENSLFYEESESKHLTSFECAFARCHVGQIIESSRKQSFTVFYVTSGSFRYNGEDMLSGDAAFVEPFSEFSPICTEDRSEIYLLSLEGDITVHVAQMLRSFSSDAVYKVGFRESIASLFDSVIYNKFMGEISVKQLIIGFTDMLLAYLSRASHPDNSQRKPDDIISRAKSAIEEGYADLTVEQLSNILYVNSKYLSKIFRKHLNITPKQYITETKLIHAEHYLVNTEYPIQKISEIVGYNNYTNFYIAFKNKYGIAPEEYRREFSDHDAAHKAK